MFLEFCFLYASLWNVTNKIISIFLFTVEGKLTMKLFVKGIFIVLFFTLFTYETFAQWIERNKITTESLLDIVMLNSVTAIVVGYNGSILKTTNSGITWDHKEPQTDFKIKWNRLSFNNNLHGVAVGDSFIATTTNGGEVWELKSFSVKETFLSASYSFPNQIYVGSDSGRIFLSVDSGKTWTFEKITSAPIRSIFIWTGTNVFSMPIYALTPNSIFIKSNFPPTPWTETKLSNFQGLGSEAFNGSFVYGGGTGYIVGVQGDKRYSPAILRKQLSDTTWYNISPPTLFDGIFRGISAPSDTVAYVCGYSGSGIIYKTTDGGNNWTLLNSPKSQSLLSIYFYNEMVGFAVGDNGTILYTNSGGIITSVENEFNILPAEFSLHQNYPNPFNLETVISYQLPVSSFVTLKVYDVLGREVTTLVNQEKEAGTHQIRFNVTQAGLRNIASSVSASGGYASGIYFYRLQAGDYFQTKKMILLK